MSDDLPVQRAAGVEYLSCEWCGEAVSQVGTRTPRRYCKRSHRQRAFEARRLGVPMARDRDEAGQPAGPVSPSPLERAEEERRAREFVAQAVEQAGVPEPAPADEAPRPRRASRVPTPPSSSGAGWRRAVEQVAAEIEQPALFDR